MTTHLEILFCPMFTDAEGASYLDRIDRGDREPDFYDIEVLRYHDDESGQIDVVESFEDMTETKANEVFDAMEAKYPDAHHNTLE